MTQRGEPMGFVIDGGVLGGDRFMVPHRFIGRYFDFGGDFLLNTKDSRGWFINIERHSDSVWLEEAGWKRFVNFYKINRKDTILFKYTGEGRFVVSLFDANGLQYNNDHEPRTILPYQCYVRVLTEDYHTKFCLPDCITTTFGRRLPRTVTLVDRKHEGTTWTVQCSYVDGSICLEGEGWTEFVLDCNLQKHDLLFFRYDGTRNLKVKFFAADGGLVSWMKKLDDRLKVLWLAKLSKPATEINKPLYVPISVIHSELFKRPENIQVKLPSGDKETWDLIWTDRRRF